MSDTKGTILVVDDEPFNLEILVEHLEDEGYDPLSAEDGLQAWQMLEQNPERFDTVLLDRMMPDMDGMEVLKRIKQHQLLAPLPVIMQTAKAGKDDVLEGLQAGAYYYLTKPFEKEAMLAIVDTAVADFRRYRSLQQDAAQTNDTLTLLEHGRFSFQTMEQGQALAKLLAKAWPNSQSLVIGLSELFFNAVEHGNLGISYQEKTRLVEQGDWHHEVDQRLSQPDNKEKKVTVDYRRLEDGLEFLITDNGDGFDWRKYLDMSPERVFDNHGRGIAMARMLSFQRIEYRGKGNQVLAVVASD